jgi:hypothetical protein
MSKSLVFKDKNFCIIKDGDILWDGGGIYEVVEYIKELKEWIITILRREDPCPISVEESDIAQSGIVGNISDDLSEIKINDPKASSILLEAKEKDKSVYDVLVVYYDRFNKYC